MNRQWDCIVSKKHVLSTNFYGNKKEEQRNFSMVKEYGRHEVSSIQALIFSHMCVVVFLTSIFLFQRAFNYFISKILFRRGLPIQKYLSDGMFVIVYLPKECLLNNQSVSLCKVSKTLRILKKTMPSKLNVFTQLYQKEYYFEVGYQNCISKG